jgi:RsiW-degrading membrane proteinase PrsW (M82 family)
MGFTYALAGMIPALLAMYYVDRLDAARPEPRWQLRKVAILGGLATIPVIFIEKGFDAVGFNPHSPIGALFTSYVTAGFTEETAKALVLLLAVWRHPAFDERMDGIVYATRAGLGFALVENVGYLLGTKTAGGFAGMFIARAILAVPLHAICAGFMGYYAAIKRFDNRGPGMLGGLLIAIFLHGTYDGAIFMCGALPKGSEALVLLLLPVPLAVVLLGLLRLKRLARDALAMDEVAHPGRPRLPPGLGFVLR